MAYVYSNLGVVYTTQGKYNEAEKYLKIAIEKGKEMDNFQIVGQCELNLGNVEFYKGDLDRALENFEESLKISKKIEDKETEIESLANIAEVLEKEGKIKRAMKYYNDVMSGAKNVGNKYIFIYALSKIGKLHYYLAEYEKSISILNASIQDALALNLKDIYYKSSLTLIRVYMQLGFYDKSMTIFHNIPEKINIPEIESELLELKGEYYLLLRNTKEIENVIKRLKKLGKVKNNPDMLLKYYNLKIDYLMWKDDTERLGAFVQKVENIINGMNYWSREGESIFLSLAGYFLSVNDYTSALSLAEIVKKNAEESEAIEDLIDALIIEGEIYSDIKKEKEALKSFESAAQLSYKIYASLENEQKNRFFNIRKRIFPFQSAFSLYLKKGNLPLLLKFHSNVPEEISGLLLDFGNKINPDLVSQIKKYLNK